MVYEGALPASNAGAFRRYIGGVAIATFYKATGIDQTRYQHTDHLGSVTALSDEGGQIAAQMAFDPWGGARIRGLALLRPRFDPTRRRYGRLK